MASDLFDRELQTLVVADLEQAIPDDARVPLTIGVSRRRLRPVALAGAAAGLLVAANFVALRLSPGYASTLAAAPVVGRVSAPVLRFLGLNPASVQTGSGTAYSSGHEVQLVGSSADSVRTILLVEVDNQPLQVPGKTVHALTPLGYLTDQYGQTYNQEYSAGLGMQFGPLRGPASHGSTRVTVHVTSLGDTLTGKIIDGDWQLQLNLTRQPGLVLATPAPIVSGDLTYEFTSARLSGEYLDLNWIVLGPLPSGSQSVGSSLFNLLKSDAGPVQFIDGGCDFGQHRGQHPASCDLHVIIPGPGLYTISFGGPQSSQLRVPPAGA